MNSTNDRNSLRNGRSSSEISIFDYPEHLNPFYESENHKRIRFWKIGKNKNDNGGNSNRRGSFSLGGLKEMWAFKTFRLKKKSSTLGINKTSESPPELRRHDFTGNYDDNQIRHTVQASNFERNVPYRISLQDVRSTSATNRENQNGFGRNERYRSTIQTPARMKRYENSSPLKLNETLAPHHRRSSQVSIASSTNPFDDDDDDDNDIIVARCNSAGTHSQSVTPNSPLNKRPVRKKRHAPPPPPAVVVVAVPQVSETKEDELASQDIQILHPDNEEITNISNLTAEIESFVSKRTTDIGNELDLNSNCDQDNSSNQIIINEPISIEISSKTIKTHNDNVILINNELEAEKIANINNRPRIILLNDETITIEENIHSKPNTMIINETNQSIIQNSQYPDGNCSKIKDIPKSNDTNLTKKTIVNNDEISPTVELRITESTEDISEKSDFSEKSCISNESPYGKYHIRYIPLKEGSPQAEIRPRTSPPPPPPTTTATGDKPVPAVRRRSVRDIIESINRSQSLLKPNKKDMTDNKNEFEQKYVKNISDCQTVEIKINNNEMMTNKNPIIFEKCTQFKNNSRETSPTTSNLDWNPVPKPKRTKKLSPELTSTD